MKLPNEKLKEILKGNPLYHVIEGMEHISKAAECLKLGGFDMFQFKTLLLGAEVAASLIEAIDTFKKESDTACLQ